MSKLEDTYHRILRLKRAQAKAVEVARQQEEVKARLVSADNAAAKERLEKILARVRTSGAGSSGQDHVEVSVSSARKIVVD